MVQKPDPPGEMARRFKALGEPSRIQMIGLLARRPHYAEELAEALALHPATISHHLRILREAGLTQSIKQSPYILFQLDRANVEELSLLLSQPMSLGESLGLPGEEQLSQAILSRFLDTEGKLIRIPSQRRARSVCLRWIASHFETGRIYPERELRLQLLVLHDDVKSLQKALLNQGWLQQTGNAFRRIEEIEEI